MIMQQNIQSRNLQQNSKNQVKKVFQIELLNCENQNDLAQDQYNFKHNFSQNQYLQNKKVTNKNSNRQFINQNKIQNFVSLDLRNKKNQTQHLNLQFERKRKLNKSASPNIKKFKKSIQEKFSQDLNNQKNNSQLKSLQIGKETDKQFNTERKIKSKNTSQNSKKKSQKMVLISKILQNQDHVSQKKCQLAQTKSIEKKNSIQKVSVEKQQNDGKSILINKDLKGTKKILNEISQNNNQIKIVHVKNKQKMHKIEQKENLKEVLSRNQINEDQFDFDLTKKNSHQLKSQFLSTEQSHNQQIMQLTKIYCNTRPSSIDKINFAKQNFNQHNQSKCQKSEIPKLKQNQDLKISRNYQQIIKRNYEKKQIGDKNNIQGIEECLVISNLNNKNQCQKEKLKKISSKIILKPCQIKFNDSQNIKEQTLLIEQQDLDFSQNSLSIKENAQQQDELLIKLEIPQEQEKKVFSLLQKNQNSVHNFSLNQNNHSANLSKLMNDKKYSSKDQTNQKQNAIISIISNLDIVEGRCMMGNLHQTRNLSRKITNDFYRQNQNIQQELGNDIMSYMIIKQREINLNGFLAKHEITQAYRAKMVDWMVEVTWNFRCNDQTFFLAVSLLDRYFKQTSQSIHVNDLHLLGIACLFLASKYEDIVPLKMHLVHERIAHQIFEINQIKQKEQDIIQSINYDINAPTVLDFLKLYLLNVLQIEIQSNEETQKKINNLYNSNGIFPRIQNQYYISNTFEQNEMKKFIEKLLIEKMSIYLSKLCMFDINLSVREPSLLAAGSFYVSLKICEQLLHRQIITQQIVYNLILYSRIDEPSIFQISQKVLFLAQNFEKQFVGLNNLKDTHLKVVSFFI